MFWNTLYFSSNKTNFTKRVVTSEFTGISNPFETPTNAIYSVDATNLSIEENAIMLFNNVFQLSAF